MTRFAFASLLVLAAAPQVLAHVPHPRRLPLRPPTPKAAIASRAAWLYKGSDITPDPAWRFGTLKNGLRYAVRKNGVPPGQISMRVRIDVGLTLWKPTPNAALRI